MGDIWMILSHDVVYMDLWSCEFHVHRGDGVYDYTLSIDGYRMLNIEHGFESIQPHQEVDYWRPRTAAGLSAYWGSPLNGQGVTEGDEEAAWYD